jgi:hypothetical protein
VDFLKTYLRNRLFSAFGAGGSRSVESIQCHVDYGTVTVGGFGATWHQDASSLQTFEGEVCEYLALYYLEPSVAGGNNWLECALTPDAYDDTSLMHSFIPVSTRTNSLLVLRNDRMLHRTPLLANLVQSVPSEVRRFFYIPFRALDSSNKPVLLEPPTATLSTATSSRTAPAVPAGWHPYTTDETIQTRITAELREHGISISMDEYVTSKGEAFKDDKTYSNDCPNWLINNDY